MSTGYYQTLLDADFSDLSVHTFRSTGEASASSAHKELCHGFIR